MFEPSIDRRAFARGKLDALRTDVAVLQHQVKERSAALDALDTSQAARKIHAEKLRLAAAAMQQLLDAIAARNIAKVEELVNAALRTVIIDQVLTFRLISEIKRNTVQYRAAVFQGDVEGNSDSFGGGVYALIAAMLKILFNRFAKRYPLVVFDESLSFLATKYIDDASLFFKSLSDKFGMPILLVSHQEQFAENADHLLIASRKDETTTIFTRKTLSNAGTD